MKAFWELLFRVLSHTLYSIEDVKDYSLAHKSIANIIYELFTILVSSIAKNPSFPCHSSVLSRSVVSEN